MSNSCIINERIPAQSPATSYREVQMGRTLYRVTSVFLGEKDLGETLEQIAIRKAMTDIRRGEYKPAV